MISAIFFVNEANMLILQRQYRNDLKKNAIENFRTRFIVAKKLDNPIVCMDNNSFLWHREGDIFIVAVTRSNANAALVFQFLYTVISTFKAYFSGVLDERAIRHNFVVVYELLDEMMDNGFPQITSLESLRRVVLSGKAAETKQVVKDTKVTDDITGKTDYRKAGIRHERNQVFLDVFEAVNLLMSSTGELLRSDCSGKIMMNTYLSGMPECQLGLNDQLMIKHQKAAAQKRGEKKRSKNRQSIVIDDIQFHRCVQLGQWDSERLISFIPPDGEFQLMKYRCTTVSLPFSLVPSLTETATTVTYSITIIGSFPSGYTATNVVVSIPTPDNTARCTITQPEPSMFQRNPNEKAKFNLQKKSIFWKINKFPGDGKFTLTAEVKRLTGIQQRAWSRPPISVDFQIGQWKPSGLKVEFLRVFEKGNYTPTNWVRYMAKAGQYQFRI